MWPVVRLIRFRKNDRKEDSLVGDVGNEAAKTEMTVGALYATSDLLKGMKGNKGKRDAVVDLAPTVGHL
jgi:hypothetical protein